MDPRDSSDGGGAAVFYARPGSLSQHTIRILSISRRLYCTRFRAITVAAPAAATAALQRQCCVEFIFMLISLARLFTACNKPNQP